jgi:hypothetical protein
MAQGSYLSTYRTYKAGTKRLATWLVQAAKLCGVDITPSATDKHEIPLGQFVHLAQTVTESKEPKITVPPEIITIIRTVIKLRKEAAAIFAKLTGRSVNASSNVSHRHFISILEQVLKVLAPSAGDKSQETTIELANIFEALSVEKPLLAHGTTEASSSKKKANAPPSQQYGIEDSAANETLFAILGFLKDYEEIEKVVIGSWLNYRFGRLDLMAASVTTDTAYGIIKRSSEDLLSSLPGQKTYSDICNVLANADFFEEGRQRGTVSVELAQYLAMPAESLLSSFADILHAKEIPVYNGQFGYYDAAENLPNNSPQEQHQHNLKLLLEYLPEITKMSRANIPFPAQDEMTAGLRIMMATNNGMDGCPMHAIFATKLFLNVHRALGVNAVDPFGELQATAKRCVTTIDDWFKFSNNKQFMNWPAHNNNGLRQIKAFVQEWVQQDCIGKFHAKVAGRVRFDDGKPVPFLFLQRNPVACGLLMLRLNLLLQEAGQTLVGAWGSAIYPIHLYNACRHSAGLDLKWEDAEYLYQLHTPQRLFVGAPPKDPQEYLKRFLLMLGASASNFARNRRQGGSNMVVPSKKGPRGLKTTSPVRDTFAPRYVDTKSAVLSTSNITAMVSVANKAQRTHPPLAGVDALTRSVANQQQLSPAQLLTCVREGVAAEEMALLFDYFGAHERGIKLLREVKTAVHDDLVKHYGAEYIQDESQLPYVVGYIFDIVAGGDREAEQLKLSDTGSKILHKTSEVVKAFLTRENTGMQGLTRTRGLTRAVQYAYGNNTLADLQIWDPQRSQDEQRGDR